MARWQIPEPVPVDWQMRTLDSARITSEKPADGGFRQVIEHAPLPGITPAMCLWYLERVDTELTWRDRTVLAYRLWHPRDHIFFKRLGTFGAGDRWHIVEAFGADRRFLLDQVFHVTKIDETGFRMEVRRLGRAVLTADEAWRPEPAGLSWTVTMTLHAQPSLLRPVSALITRRAMPILHRWRQHNVEEAGNLPRFLPELYAGRS
jgi:hypothetical protein